VTRGLCFGVFGDPVQHSRSPAMHNAAFLALALPHRYHAFHVRPPDLDAALAAVCSLGLGGVNLTVPHKTAALRSMARLGAEAERIGAVNTVCVVEGELEGHNTDGRGFWRALESVGGAAATDAVVLGSGGAALAVIDAIRQGAPASRLRWVSRAPGAHMERTGVEPTGYSDLDLGGADLLVNTTTVGMVGGPTEFPMSLPLAGLDAGAKVVDLVYPRPSGGLLDQAEARGLTTQDGLPMLLWQGIFALELWLGEALPGVARDAMAAALRTPT